VVGKTKPALGLGERHSQKENAAAKPIQVSIDIENKHYFNILVRIYFSRLFLRSINEKNTSRSPILAPRMEDNHPAR
jgi:hypothetical protein